MKGERYGNWIVAAVIYAEPWPWAWLVRVGNPMVQARVSVHSLNNFDAA